MNDVLGQRADLGTGNKPVSGAVDAAETRVRTVVAPAGFSQGAIPSPGRGTDPAGVAGCGARAP